MINLQLYILNDNGESYDEVELYDNESVSYTQSLQDIRDISKIFSDFTRTFNVPASKINNKIFKHFYNYFIDGFDPKKRHKAKLFLNYKLYKEGYIKLEGATTKDNRPFTYKLTFFGNGLILKDVFREAKLSSLTYLKAFNFDYTSANVIDYLKNGLDGEIFIPKKNEPASTTKVEIEDAIVFPLISHTNRMIYDSNSSYAAVTGQSNLANVTNGGLQITELKPAIRLHAIVKAIEAQYRDQDIIFTEDFFKASNTSYYNLYMWLHTKTGGLFQDQEDGTFTGDLTIQNDNSTSTIKRSVGLIENGNSFTVPHPQQEINNPTIAGFQRKLSLYVQTSVAGKFTVIVYDSEGNEFFSKEGERDPDTNRFVAIEEKDPIDLDKGTYTFAIRSNTPGNFFVHAKVERKKESLLGNRYIEFFGEAVVGSDTEVNSRLQMPNMTILDFLTGLFKMFNLTSFVNDENKIVIQTLDAFYEAAESVHNITEFIDKDTIQVDSVVPYRTVSFSYKGTNTFLARFYGDTTNKEWGALHYNRFSKDFGGDYKIELPFEHMLFEKLTDANDSSDTGIQIGWSADDKQEPTIGEPLLFYAVKTPVKEAVKLIKFNSTTEIIAANGELFMPSNSLEVDETLTNSANINFASENNEYALVPFKNTLFDQFYKNYILDIFDPQRRITTTKAYLPLRILSNLKLNDQIQIADRLYKINKVTTDFKNLLTKFELINTLETFGKNIVRDTIPKQGELVSDEGCVTADDDFTTIDNTVLLVDCTASKSDDGYVIIKDTNDGTTAENNNPDTSKNGEPVEVTPATIFDSHLSADMDTITADSDLYKADVNLREVTSSTFKIGHQVKELGKIGTAPNIDEYGFLWSTTSADLQGTDVDDIAAVAGVTKIDYPTASNNKRPTTPFNSTYKNNSASTGVTYYFRFYARTNTNIDYAEADAISEIEEVTTL
tara:strand:+ start:7141 stop:9978 length:2838 start_codon:yes stop_codon:yes gene_type:complete